MDGSAIMPRWKWYAEPDEPLDQVGPATSYGTRTGAYAPDWATERTDEYPTVDSAPLLTRGAKARSGNRGNR